MTAPTDTPAPTTGPQVSDNLKAFFHAEFANEEAMRREAQEEYDATFDEDDDLYVPPSTLASALDSWSQGDEDIHDSFLHIDHLPPTERAARRAQAHDDLNALIAYHGGDTRLDLLV